MLAFSDKGFTSETFNYLENFISHFMGKNVSKDTGCSELHSHRGWASTLEQQAVSGGSFLSGGRSLLWLGDLFDYTVNSLLHL